MPDQILPQATPWYRSGLFWRTFFLVGFLIIASMAAWITSFRLIEREPAARQSALQIASIVKITRSALTHSDPEWRRELLQELANNEGIRIYPLEKTDEVAPPPDGELSRRLVIALHDVLGKDTRISKEVNGLPGLWISFVIEDTDEYWMRLQSSRWERSRNLQWLGWAGAVLLLSLLGAGFLSQHINEPLARLSAAARRLSIGEVPEHLPEKGAGEIREVNHSFNQMMDDLAQVESERTEILAGISHDLRTPLTRMQLELELTELPEEARNGMQADLNQMNAIVGQFLDFARVGSTGDLYRLSVTELMTEIVLEQKRNPVFVIQSHIEPDLICKGNETDFRRIMSNLFANASLYGKTPNTEHTEIFVICQRRGDRVVIQVADRGVGIPASERTRLLRPFTRADYARGQANGSGLGLAIVLRIVRRFGGQLSLQDHECGGLMIEMSFPFIAPGGVE